MSSDRIKKTLTRLSIAALIGSLSVLPACCKKVCPHGKEGGSCGSCGSKAKSTLDEHDKGGSSCGKGSCGGGSK